MKFIVSEKIISKKKRNPFFVFFYSVIITSPFLYKLYQDENLDLILLSIIVFMIIAGTLANTFGTYRSIKEMKLLSANISSRGIEVDNSSEKLILPIERIKKVHVKYNKDNIKKIIIETISNEKYDYSIYENLNQFNNELKKILDESFWD